ncbi:uncharacterized protein V1518DRAFT_49370 [Limtongia smithiae]|uniref:uncharacterized protein n=1 Tax=Limtongia smithiae TaxID=1125753 RepID=UPI0034CFE405
MSKKESFTPTAATFEERRSISSSLSTGEENYAAIPLKNVSTTPGLGAGQPSLYRRRSTQTTLRPKSTHDKDTEANNPLKQLSQDEVINAATQYATEHGLAEHIDLFCKGALVARDPESLGEGLPLLTDADRDALEHASLHKWAQPTTLYVLVIACSLAAAVQGMDETVINGANLFFPSQFGIGSDSGRDTWLVGLVNSAPYLCCAVAGCWVSDPLNRFFGRRGTIFISCFIAAATCIWSACTDTWWHLFIARFFLGFGIGAKSATVPVYAAECTPARIRGALVMMWQMWTAFGIMLGYVADVAFYNVPDTTHITGMNWRLMLGSAMAPAVIVCAQVFFCPESPRWCMSRGRHVEAFEAMCRLRQTRLEAARDLFYMHALLVEEEAAKRARTRSTVIELFAVARNRRAALASWIVMFMQQFCGVNVIAYYSSVIFTDSGFSEISALLASMGFGIVNFVFAIPAVYTIDTFGRRFLLLTTFPLMALFLLFTGFSFFISADTARIACVALGIYLFGIVYSPGEGPVPFTYSAEAFPLYVRDVGMSFATATTWFFNFVLSLTWPALKTAFTVTGAFGWYAAWNVAGFFLVLFFVPETKALTLEELDSVFGVSTITHMKYQYACAQWWTRRHVLRDADAVEPVPLYAHDIVAEAKTAPDSTEVV